QDLTAVNQLLSIKRKERLAPCRMQAYPASFNLSSLLIAPGSDKMTPRRLCPALVDALAALFKESQFDRKHFTLTRQASTSAFEMKNLIEPRISRTNDRRKISAASESRKKILFCGISQPLDCGGNSYPLGFYDLFRIGDFLFVHRR